MAWGVSLADARDHNRAASVGDGIVVDAEGRTAWSPQASAAIDTSGPEVRDALCGVLDDTDIEESARRVRDLRERLVAQRL